MTIVWCTLWCITQIPYHWGTNYPSWGSVVSHFRHCTVAHSSGSLHPVIKWRQTACPDTAVQLWASLKSHFCSRASVGMNNGVTRSALSSTLLPNPASFPSFPLINILHTKFPSLLLGEPILRHTVNISTWLICLLQRLGLSQYSVEVEHFSVDMVMLG